MRGNDYYLYVKLIELADKAPNGSVWDRVDGSGPDIGFRLTWRNNVVWDATVKPDTLIGSWDLMKIDLKQVVMSGGKADLEGALNAPLIHYEPGETVELSVWDADAVGAYDDAGKVVIKLDDFGPGETSLAAGRRRREGDQARRVRTDRPPDAGAGVDPDDVEAVIAFRSTDVRHDRGVQTGRAPTTVGHDAVEISPGCGASAGAWSSRRCCSARGWPGRA